MKRENRSECDNCWCDYLQIEELQSLLKRILLTSRSIYSALLLNFCENSLLQVDVSEKLTSMQ